MIRPLTPADVEWVVELTRQRRTSLAPHAPRFWNPAPDATSRHREFLGSLVAASDVYSVRSDHGYLIALDSGSSWLVDDMVVSPDDAWPTEGVALLRHALERCGRIRFVVPAFETARLAAAYDVGLAAVECWWHRDLDAAREGGTAEAGQQLTVAGATGRLVPAPPVYDPHGPVLLVTAVDSATGLRNIEAVAAHQGATVSVVSQAPGDRTLAALLEGTGHRLTTRFLES